MFRVLVLSVCVVLFGVGALGLLLSLFKERKREITVSHPAVSWDVAVRSFGGGVLEKGVFGTGGVIVHVVASWSRESVLDVEVFRGLKEYIDAAGIKLVALVYKDEEWGFGGGLYDEVGKDEEGEVLVSMGVLDVPAVVLLEEGRVVTILHGGLTLDVIKRYLWPWIKGEEKEELVVLERGAGGRKGKRDIVEEGDLVSFFKTLECLQCEGLTLWDSSAPLALDLKMKLKSLAAGGLGEEGLREWLWMRYGGAVFLERGGGIGTLLFGLSVLVLSVLLFVVLVLRERKRG